MTKRITALLLSVVLCLSLVGSAFAAGEESTITGEPGSKEITVDLKGLPEGATYYLCSLLVKESEDADFKIVKSFNFKVKEGGVFTHTFSDGAIPELKDGGVLRVQVPGVDLDGAGNDYIENTVGGETESPVTAVTLPKTLSVSVKGTKTLTAGLTPADGSYDSITWASSDESVLTVAANESDASKAAVKGVKAGKATVTVTVVSANGETYTASCEVTVSKSSGGGGGGGGGSVSSGYAVSVNRTSNGSVSVSPSRAEKGDTVTITVRPNSGYELDKLTVTDEDGRTIRVTRDGDNTYTFTMPDGKVEIDAVFKAVEKQETPAPSVTFSDVPSSFWAYDQITWAANKGIMGGYGNGIFAPDRNVTRQQLWMVLGRLNGSSPADMAAARAWAINNGVSDGTNATGTMSRQQMVTMLYRYAQLKGYSTSGSASLSAYPDGGSVAGYAREALSWAVANGIMGGTSAGTLNPAGTASRAHFAVFMYRFCALYGIA